MVGVTGFEPMASRPPGVRATKLRQTPLAKLKAPEASSVFDYPRELQGGCSQNMTTATNNVKLPNQYDIQENHIHRSSPRATFSIA